MKRRSFVFALPSLVAARQAIAMTDLNSGRLGICTFSCHRHWEAVRKHETGIRFQDVPSFYDYIHELGADGMQTSVRGMDLPAVRTLRRQMEMDGSYFEGDIRLPKSKAELSDFEKEVQITKEAGASVARAVLTGGRRYEVFHSIAEFQQFHSEARERLGLVEPILKKYGLKLAIENHKDLTIEEHATLMRQIDSEWIGSLVDTGNNIALLDDPYRCIDFWLLLRSAFISKIWRCKWTKMVFYSAKSLVVRVSSTCTASLRFCSRRIRTSFSISRWRREIR
jgi:hypothetical protein